MGHRIGWVSPRSLPADPVTRTERNGEDVTLKRGMRIVLAISLDNRERSMEALERLEKVENHPLHKLTLKRVGALLGGFLPLSAVYIEESRDLLIEAAKAVFGIFA